MPPTAPPAFRLSAYTVFLTYAQSGETSKEDIRDFVTCCGKNLEYMVVAKELHEDGSPHIHVTAKFKTKLNIRAANYFDYDGIHPNVQSARNWAHCVEYCKKDGDYLEVGDCPSEESVFFDYHFRY